MPSDGRTWGRPCIERLAVLLDHLLGLGRVEHAGGDQLVRIQLRTVGCWRITRYITGCVAAGSSASL